MVLHEKLLVGVYAHVGEFSKVLIEGGHSRLLAEAVAAIRQSTK